MDGFSLKHMPVEVDPVVELARDVGRARREYNAFDEARLLVCKEQNSREYDRLEEMMKQTDDREAALRDTISVTQAISLSGAAVQIIEAILVFDMLRDQLPEEADTYDHKRQCRQIVRLLYSALAVVDQESEETLSSVVDENYVQPQCNPWLDFRSAPDGAQEGGAS